MFYSHPRYAHPPTGEGSKLAPTRRVVLPSERASQPSDLVARKVRRVLMPFQPINGASTD